MRTLTTFFLLFLYLNLFPQDDKTVKNFENAINKGYINSPTLIPITIVANKEKKHFLSNTESLYYAAEKEINEIHNMGFMDFRSTGSYPTTKDI